MKFRVQAGDESLPVSTEAAYSRPSAEAETHYLPRFAGYRSTHLAPGVGAMPQKHTNETQIELWSVARNEPNFKNQCILSRLAWGRSRRVTFGRNLRRQFDCLFNCFPFLIAARSSPESSNVMHCGVARRTKGNQVLV